MGSLVWATVDAQATTRLDPKLAAALLGRIRYDVAYYASYEVVPEHELEKTIRFERPEDPVTAPFVRDDDCTHQVATYERIDVVEIELPPPAELQPASPVRWPWVVALFAAAFGLGLAVPFLL